MYKKLYFIGIIPYVFMLVMALAFYKERTVFLDAAFNLFYIICKGGFAITIFRFGDLVTQLPPVLAVRAGLPLDTIFQVYSAGFVVYYFAAYLICGSILKRYDFALVILLLGVLVTAHTFYWMLSELPQAIAMFIIVLALLSGRQFAATGLARWCVAVALLLVVVFFHPLMVFIICYTVFFFWLNGDGVVDKRTTAAIAIIYVSGMIMKFLLFRTPYESHSMSGMKNFILLFPNYLDIYSNRHFLEHCLSLYYWIPVFFLLVLAHYLARREVKKTLLLLAFFGGYLALVNISYPTPATPDFYIENLYVPLVIFLAFPFVFDVLPVLIKRKMALPVFALLIASGCVRMYAAHPVYTARLDYERQILNRYGEQKVVLKATLADTSALLMTWGAPYEMLLLAESERNKTASVIIDPDPGARRWEGSHKNALVVNYNTIPYTDLPSRYFHFTDTVTSYTVLK